MTRRLVVGLTGGIGSGKSTVADLLAARGATVVDTDAVAHALTGPDGEAMPAIARAFGSGVVGADGRLDRTAMRAIAFADPSQRRRLEAILHPMIRERSEAAIAAATGRYVVSVVPLLIESGAWKQRCDRVLVVDCPVEVQIERVIRRSALPREQAMAIVAAQASRQQRLAAADDVIDNAGEPDALPAQVDAVHARYLAIAEALEADAQRSLSPHPAGPSGSTEG